MAELDQKDTYLLARLAERSSYHNHKETVALTVFALQATLFGWIWTDHAEALKPLGFWLATALLICIWLFANLMMRNQLNLKRIAAAETRAIEEEFIDDVPNAVASAVPPNVWHWVDRYLFPTRYYLRPALSTETMPSSGESKAPTLVSAHVGGSSYRSEIVLWTAGLFMLDAALIAVRMHLGH